MTYYYLNFLIILNSLISTNLVNLPELIEVSSRKLIEAQEGKKMETKSIEKKVFLDDFKKNLPIGQSFHSGGWGFDRVLGCLNLNKCTFKSKRAAQLARARAASEQFELNQIS